MSNEVDSFQDDPDREFEACIGLAKEFLALKEKNPSAYQHAVRNLQAVVCGRFPDSPLSAEAAETILDQLAEPRKDARGEITDLLKVTHEEEQGEAFMGDPETFVTIDEAVESGQIPRDIL